MVQVTTRERVDAFWSGTLGVTPADLHASGVRVQAHAEPRTDWRGVYVLAFDDAVSVFVPPDLIDEVTKAIEELTALDAPDATTILEAETWRSMLGDAVHTAFGPVVHLYLDDPSGLSEHAVGRRINPRDADALTDLRGAIPPDEWRSAGFTGQPAMIFGLFDGDRMVAAANLTAGPDAATDIGLVIHPEERGKHYGTRMTATAAKQAILMHKVARFRVFASSAATLAIATKLGFEEYGRNAAAYLHG